MGTNFRNADHFCALEYEDDEEPVPQSFGSKIKYYLGRFKQKLPEYLPYIIIGILAVLIAFLYQAEHQKESMKAIYSNITDIKDSINARLEDIEKALTILTVSCDSCIPQEEEEKIEFSQIEDLVKKYLRKYDADKTGMIDWALESLGASIVSVRDTEPYYLGASTVLGVPCTKYSSDPSAIIRPSTMPGDCWAFKGEGTVIVNLAASIYITNFTIEHITKEMTPCGEINSAPKMFVAWGLPGDLQDGSKHCFGHYEYNSTGDPVQTYQINIPSYNAYDTVEFNFKSNYGNKDFTCVYRVRVHGLLNMASCKH